MTDINKNLNNLTGGKLVTFSFSDNITNGPYTTSAGTVICFGTAFVHQIFFDYNSGNVSVRTMYSGNWSTWKSL